MNTKVFVSKSYNPHFNLSIEEYLLKKIESDEIYFYLWQNKNTVVIGRNQNSWRECNFELLFKNEGYLARRLSGGGAVYHDLGNLNFTFITHTKKYNLHKQLKVILDALKRFDIFGEFSGRNDITINKRKFSGNAFFHGFGGSIHHGTLLVNVDMENLSKYLNVSKKKIESKGIKSVKSRVINLKELNSKIDIESLKKELMESFSNEYSVPSKIIQITSKKDIPDIESLYEKYSSKNWIFGKSPNFDYSISEKFSWGELQLGFVIKNGQIFNLTAYSDSMDVDLIDELNKIKNIPFEKNEIIKALNLLKNEKFSNEIKDIVEWIGGINL